MSEIMQKHWREKYREACKELASTQSKLECAVDALKKVVQPPDPTIPAIDWAYAALAAIRYWSGPPREPHVHDPRCSCHITFEGSYVFGCVPECPTRFDEKHTL